jgi:hypothetical protein
MQAARYILAATSDHLSDDRIWTVNSLLSAHEPTEALLSPAWNLAPHRDQLPEEVVRLLREHVGDTDGVHPAFRR